MPIEMTSRTIVEKRYADLRPRVEELVAADHTPHLAVVLVGHDPNSELYVSSIKQKRAQELGVEFTIHRLDANASEDRIMATITELNNQPSVTGIIVQLPLPENINVDRILNTVAPEKDVDGLGKNSQFLTPTVCAIMSLLEAYDIELAGKKISIVGKGRLVGGPLYNELKHLKLDVTACDESIGDNLGVCTLGADILISATGQPHLIQPALVKDGAVVIDVDCDVNYEAVLHKTSYITPQKGAVGPLTVACLLENVIEAAEKQVDA